MNKTKQIIAIFLTLLILNACSTIAEGLGGTKKKGSSEFLVEKKAPLILPPSFGELPEPGMKTDENIASTKENGLSIEEMIGQSSTIDSSVENNDLNNLIEKLVIKKINEK
jgi:PBP1b-binding outer membrane lipoprotein LpoB